MERIWMIEDDEVIRRELKTLLRNNGYMPVEGMPCDLVLLDINLPGKSGYKICQEIRKNSNVPIIFLTARENPEDEILGFGVGADDYLRKPYNSAVLLARIARLVRRQKPCVLSRGELSLDLAAMRAEFEGNRAELTKNETRILACLMEHELCSRETLIEDLWQNCLYIDENTLYVNINRLRDKLKKIGAKDYIRTVRGVGYRL